jgi:hypothetical protein
MASRPTSATAPPGETVTCDNLAAGLAMAAAGQDVQYHGAAGTYVLDDRGDSIQNQGTIWQISGNTFQNVGSELCNDEEVYPGYSTEEN